MMRTLIDYLTFWKRLWGGGKAYEEYGWLVWIFCLVLVPNFLLGLRFPAFLVGAGLTVIMLIVFYTEAFLVCREVENAENEG